MVHVLEYGDPGPPPVGAVPSSASAAVVRAEEVGIVVVVLILWVAAIALFINRWGKIRQMEPYQPYFEPDPIPQPEIAEGSHRLTKLNTILQFLLLSCLRASIFEHPSFNVLPPGSPGRRPSTLSGFIPPVNLGLPCDRRLSVFIPQRRASYFALPTRRAR